MASGTLTDLSPPDSWEDWETLVADLARRELGDPLAVKHGGKNEGDVGVDAYARYGGSDQLVGLQAKETQKLGKTKIRKNVKRAREFEPELDHYVFVWSGERSTKVQQRALDVSEMNEEEGSFPVSLWTWDDVREMLARHPDLLDAHFPDHGQRYEELKNGGFYRLSESHFEKQRDKDLEDAWSAGLRPVDVREGYAIDRWRDVSGEDEEEDDPTWVSLTGELLRRLDEENVMVRGRPGSGKSAVSVTVANQWYEQGKGALFYRPSGARRRFRADDTLRRAIETAEGHVLVVVEDAVREETKEIHDVVHDLADDDSVSFLLDGRRGEDQEFEAGPGRDTAMGRQLSYHDHVSYVDLGRMNVAEVGQMVALYEAETGEEVDVDVEHLMQRLDRPGWVGDMLHVTYHLLSGEGMSGLEADAAAKFDALNEPEDEEMARSELQRHDESLLIRSGLLLNLLNLAGIPLHRVFVDALPDAMGENHRQDDLSSLVNDALRGWLVFGDQDDEVLVGRHEFWSFHFLRYAVHGHEDEEDDPPVSERDRNRWIIDSVNAVVAVLDDPDRRSRFVDDVGATDESEESEGTTPEDVASGVLGSIFRIGSDWPTLAPLFRQDEEDDYAIRDADVCPDWLVAETLARRGDVLRKNNDLEGQKHEEEIRGAFEQAIETLGDASTDREKQAEALVLDIYAAFFHAKDEYEAAIERFERALELREEIGDRAGEATTLNNLGAVHKACGAWADAEAYYEDSLAITREIGDRAGEAATLNNLGAVHEARGAWADAKAYYEDSLAVKREIGDRAGEATTLNNLGAVHEARGAGAAAEEYYEDSLAIKREIGDRAGEATTLNNVGQIYHNRGELDAAEEHYTEALAIRREIGDRAGEATTLNNLGEVHRARGAWAAAEEYYEDSLAIKREIGDREGEAATLDNVGQIYHNRGELDAAEERYTEALAIRREIGDRQGEAVSLANLGLVCSNLDDHETAYDHLNDAAEILLDVGDVRQGLTALSHLVDVCEALGKSDVAREHCERALETIENADLPGLDDEERRFREQYAKFSTGDTEQNVLDLYNFALQRVRSEDPVEATKLFEAVWNRRDDVDEESDAYPLVLAGGVSLAGHLQMFSEVTEDQSDTDVDTILQDIQPDRDRLPLPAKAVFEYLHDGETETTPEGLRQLAELSGPADEDAENDDPPIGTLNAQVFATLLNTLQADD